MRHTTLHTSRTGGILTTLIGFIVGLGLFGALAVGAMLMLAGGSSDPQAAAQRAEARQAADAAEAAQLAREREALVAETCAEPAATERRAFVEKMIADGVFTRNQRLGSNDPRLWIGPTFRLIEPEQQRTALTVVYLDWICRTGGEFGTNYSSIVLKEDDGSTDGRRVGRFDLVGGIDWN